MALRRRWTVLRFTDTVDSPGSSASAANVQDVYTAEEEGSPWKSCVAERGDQQLPIPKNETGLPAGDPPTENLGWGVTKKVPRLAPTRG